MHTNLTYQPQPALCYISKTTAQGVTTGTLAVSNMQFNVTILGVATGRLQASIYMFKITTFDMITGIIDV